MAKQRTEAEKWAILEHCLQLERSGGDILGFLRGQGFLSPRATWINYQREWLERKPDRISDGKPKGEMNMSKITLEQKKNAVKIAIGGGNPLTYLKQLGSKNPSAAWYMIRKQLQSADPETYEKLQKRQEQEKTAAEAMNGMADAVDEFVDGVTQSRAPELVAKIDAPVTIRTPDGAEIEVQKDQEQMHYEITAIRDANLGEFHFDHDRNSVEWRTGAGEEVLMGVDGWRILADRLPEILKVLGVRA